MAFDHASLTQHVFADSRQSYTARDTILYALGLGLGADPTEPEQLRFLYEHNLAALPTMGVVLAHPGFWAGDPALGIDWARMLHVGQGLTIHRPIPVAATVIGRSRITGLIDRGADKGSLLYYERDVIDAITNDCIATIRQTLLCRGNGGAGAGGEPLPPHPLPTRAPDYVIDQTTLPQAALLYRLSGDLNPLHADPAVAAKAGFPRPILQGLALFGTAAWAALRTTCEADPARLRDFDARFTAPIFPGETIRTKLWQDGAIVSLQCVVLERDKIVLDNGKITIADASGATQ